MSCLVSYGNADQILIPTPTGDYEVRPLLNLLHLNSIEGLGLRPHRYITQRSPYQAGSTPIAVLWDDATLQIAIQESILEATCFAERRWEILDELRPNRSFRLGYAAQPLLYRRWLPGGDTACQGNDLALTAGSAEVYSRTGRFIERGLRPGMGFTISGSTADDGAYQIVGCANDYTVTLNAAMTNTETAVGWGFARGPSYRDFFCLIEQGPALDLRAGELVNPYGFKEVLRFVGHNPFWYGQPQSETWNVADNISDLVFDGDGAWFGFKPGEGRWLFAAGTVGEAIAIPYWGHELARPVIEIDGPAVAPIVISHSELGVTIVLDYSVATGETATLNLLDLIYTNNYGANLAPFVSGDVVQFGLTPDVPDRINTVNINFGGGVGGASAARLNWRSVYVGV